MFIELSIFLKIFYYILGILILSFIIDSLILISAGSIKKIDLPQLENDLNQSRLNSICTTILSLRNGFITSHYKPFYLSKYYISTTKGEIIVFRWTKAHRLIKNRFKELHRN